MAKAKKKSKGSWRGERAKGNKYSGADGGEGSLPFRRRFAGELGGESVFDEVRHGGSNVEGEGHADIYAWNADLRWAEDRKSSCCSLAGSLRCCATRGRNLLSCAESRFSTEAEARGARERGNRQGAQGAQAQGIWFLSYFPTTA